jgi:hypothetical protein
MSKTELQEYLDEIKLLEDNWDNYGAIKVSEEVINKFNEFIGCLDNNHFDLIDDFFPNGTITIEFDKDDKRLVLEIGKTNCSGFIVLNNIYSKLIDGKDLTENIWFLLNSINNLFGTKTSTRKFFEINNNE